MKNEASTMKNEGEKKKYQKKSAFPT